MAQEAEQDPTRGRWWIVIAAVLVQLALGAVYAWSVFNSPLQEQFGWSKAEAVLPFEFGISPSGSLAKLLPYGRSSIVWLPPLIVITFFDSKPSPPSACEKPRILPPCIVRFPSALMHFGLEWSTFSPDAETTLLEAK